MPGLGIGLGMGMRWEGGEPPEPAAPVNSVLPVITGSAVVGQTLTASNGSWSGYPRPSYARQWKRDGVNISGATGSTYTLTAADYGAVITVTVTATNTEGSATATSAATSAVAGTAPANTALPSITGSAVVGQTLTASAGTWTGYPTPSIAYQWNRAGAPISGATGSAYELVAADYGEVITVTVTATNAEGASSETSVGTSAVAGTAPVNTVLPSISGTARVGETLTASAGTWAGYPTPSIAYQWNRAGAPISGATSSTYTLVAADYGEVITLTITATNDEGSESETSSGTSAVAGTAPVNTVLPSISGTAAVGQTLTASAGTWAGYPTPSYSYQWNRDGDPISGAENSTYALIADDFDAVVTVTVTATNSEGTVTETSAGTDPVAGIVPANTVAPSISGTARVGETLTASAGTWTGYPTPTISYQWKRDGVNISGATSGTYQLVAADYDAVITVTVTATNSEGSSSETSAGTSAVAGLAPVNTAAPSISGTARVGETLTASAGTWTGVPTPSYSYQWNRAGAPISGATSGTYQLVAADYEAVITVTVTATNTEGSSSETSAGTSAVAGLAPVNTAAPVISGTTQVGETLSVTSGTWTGYPTPTISYQWLRDDSPISGATAGTYTLIEADAEAMIGCAVTGTNAVDTTTAKADEVGPVAVDDSLRFVGVPSPIILMQGDTYDLSQHVVGGNPPYGDYLVDTGTLPAGVTLSSITGVLTAAVDATIQTSGDITFGVSATAEA